MRRCAAALVLAWSLGATSGCFRPELPDVAFRCGDNGACPEGYECMPDGCCHRRGTAYEPADHCLLPDGGWAAGGPADTGPADTGPADEGGLSDASGEAGAQDAAGGEAGPGDGGAPADSGPDASFP